LRPIFIVGVGERKHLGGQLQKAAEKLGLEHRFFDAREAFRESCLIQKLAWKVWRRPIALGRFSQKIVQAVQREKPGLLLTTGSAPVSSAALRQIGKAGTRKANYSTDDPWNPAHRAGWFLRALPDYDRVFSTRKANLGDFAALGVRASHLPFGYDPDLYFWDRGEGVGDRGNEEAKVFLAGGGDVDRYPLVKALQEAGIGMSLWGGYWEKAGLPSGGFLDAAGIRRELALCMVSLILVRRANRDGSAMRSFEIPACGACCVAEDTEEHREIFGPDGEAVLYFRTPEELVRRVKEAFGNPELRAKLRANAHRAITGKPNTYTDRLKTMLQRLEEQKRIGED
jgi:hypothetical protein